MPPNKGRGKRSLSQDPAQKTITFMFASEGVTKLAKPITTHDVDEENAIVENFAQDLDNVFGHYKDSIAHLEQLQRLSDERDRKDRRLSRETREGRRAGRRDSFGLGFDDELDLTPAQAHSMETAADEFGTKFVSMMRTLIQRGSGCPSQTCQKQLAEIISNHDAHKTALLSAQAADTLGKLNLAFPAVSIEDGKGGKPTLAKNAGTWDPRLVGEVARWKAGQWRPDTARDRRGVMKPLDFWDILVQFTAWACESLGRTAPGSGAPPSTVEALQQHQQQHQGGGLLMLEQTAEVLLADFSCRMRVFADHCQPGGTGKGRRPADLLQCSFLGELLAAGEDAHRTIKVNDLINNLVCIIGSEASDTAEACDSDAPESPEKAPLRPHQRLHEQRRSPVVARHRLRQLARDLLQAILEYYGCLEDTGLFKKGFGRAYRSNLRVDMDKRILAAYQNVLETDEEKATFLSSLAPRDRVRFIGSVVATMRAKRNKDEGKYPQVVRVCQIYETMAQEVNEYVDVDYLEVLQYIADDFRYAEKIKGIETRESLAMVVSQLVQGATDMAMHGPASGDALLKLEKAAQTARTALMEGAPKARPVAIDVATKLHLSSVCLRLAKEE